MIRILIFWLVALTPGAFDAAPIELEAGPAQVHLIELYTSEGCSSCPPADIWLQNFQQDPGLWKQVVPVAFHVDYWNHLGWKDPFARRQYSNRQRTYHRLGAIGAVYTPSFVVDGQEWRGWFLSHPLKWNEPGDRPGTLKLSIDGPNATARFMPGPDGGDAARIVLALLGFDLKTQVRAGENRGRSLAHDFVVLNLLETDLAPHSTYLQASVTLPTVRGNAKGIAAWVTDGRHPRPIQAVGGLINVDSTTGGASQ